MKEGMKMRVLMWLWLLGIALAVLMMLYHCQSSSQSRFQAPGKDLCDSLQRVAVAGAQQVAYGGVAVWFDSAHHVPACVTYELTESELEGTSARTNEFAPDTHVKGCPLPQAYAQTGLHRGHMAPAGDMVWSETAMHQSFLMTNVCPQHRSLNEGGWARLEEKCREWVRRDSALIIATGPVLEAGLDTMASGVVVPKRYYKVVLAHCVSPMRAVAFIYNNGPCNGPLSRYAVSVDEVERLTGIDFFAALPPDVQQRMESACNLQVWLH